LNLVVRDRDGAHCLKTLGREFSGGGEPAGVRLDVKERVATVSVAGGSEWNGKGLVSHAFAALGGLGTRVIAVAQESGETGVSFCIPEAETAAAVRFLHRELGLEAER